MPTVARIHYEIPDELYRKPKSAAALKGLTLKDFVIEALDEAAQEAEGAAEKRRRRSRAC